MESFDKEYYKKKTINKNLQQKIILRIRYTKN